MKLLITRAAVIAAGSGVRAFAPGLSVEVDAAAAQQILAQQAGIPIESDASTPMPATAPVSQSRRRKSADDQA